MYSIEYRWTKLETPVTTINIITVKGSKKKAQFAMRLSQCIQSIAKIKQFEPLTVISKKTKSESKKVKKIDVVETKQQP